MPPNFSFQTKKSIISWSPRLSYKTSEKGEDLSFLEESVFGSLISMKSMERQRLLCSLTWMLWIIFQRSLYLIMEYCEICWVISLITDYPLGHTHRSHCHFSYLSALFKMELIICWNAFLFFHECKIWVQLP